MPREIIVKSVLNKTKKRDAWFLDDYTFNPYSSCSFNCLYCYIRGSKYGTNLEQSLSIKVNAVEMLEKQLAVKARKKEYGIIVLSSATDPYLQIEEKYQITRRALEVILKYKFPIHIITKSDLVIRDFDLLKEINRQAILPKELNVLGCGVIISFSFSTLEDDVGSIFEPGATKPSLRIQALQGCLDHNFLTGVSLMPLLPYISDTSENLDIMFKTFSRMKVDYVLPATITLFGHGRADSKTLMLNAIAKNYPHLLEKYTRFFSNSHQMPTYYQVAFKKKMEDTLKEYGLANSILAGADIKNVKK